MAKDPAFLFYPGDASEDTQFMNRLERGCYFDLLKAQKKFRRFNLVLIKKVLGNDFQACWPSLESVLRKEGDLYFIGWADDAIENRAAHAEKQKKRIKDYWDKKKSESIPEPNQNDTTEQPKQNRGNSLENEIVNENENEIKKEDESEILAEYEYWTQAIIDGIDHKFQQMFMKELIPPGPHIQFWISDHLDLLNRYPRMRPPDQHAFRRSCLKHIRENFKKQPNGKSNSNIAHTTGLAEDFAKRHSSG
ncbi:MAG TPA: hypothetical protein VD884_13390 [Ohtaekwangia sp.]|nr:hypothetical protein [Ohtaekwangia sp.]